MKKVVLFLFAISVAGLAKSQSLSNELISNSGTYYSNGVNSLSWSIGEVMTETYVGTNNILTQGFNQGQLVFVGIEELALDFEINIYPNPTNGVLKIDISDVQKSGNLKAQIFDITGKLILENDLNQNNTIDFSNYSVGVYLISILNSDKIVVKNGKIIKN